MTNSKKIPIADLSSVAAVSIIGDETRFIASVANLKEAGQFDLSYCISSKFVDLLKCSQAGAVILPESLISSAPKDMVLLVSKNPEADFARIATFFDPTPVKPSGIHPTAVVSTSAVIDSTAVVGAQCVIGDSAKIGANTVIGPGTIIGDRVSIGENCQFHSHVTLYHDVQIADRVILHSGVVIGADGFGFANENGHWIKIPQIKAVIVHSDVEIGANSCVDRGALQHTVIENGVKIDNMVQIAHNVIIGAHTAIAGKVAVAGSAKIGRYCMLAGDAKIAGHITICDQAVITGGAIITRSITTPGVYSSGTGFMPNREWRKSAVRFRHLDELFRRVKQLEDLNNE